MKSYAYEQVARVGRALGSGHRLELLELIAQAEQSVDTLARLSGMGVTTVSSHLQTLKGVGLVRTRRDGTTIYYRLAGDKVAELVVTLNDVASETVPDLILLAENDPDQAIVPMLRDVQEVDDSFVLDVRPAQEFAAGHYPGAASIPLAELPERAEEVPLDRRVVVYCRGEFCLLARDAARLLRDRGVDAYAMDQGVLEWRGRGHITLSATA